MAFHHVAITTRDVKASHAFYTQAMGFRLAKVEAGKTEGGWAKHLFYDTGDGMLALWDLHDETLPADYKTDLSESLGLPIWTNHIAFTATDLEDLERRKKRWLDNRLSVMQVDHGWCESIYTRDPSGIMVEFCTSKRELTEADAEEAARLLEDPNPEPREPASPPRFFRPERA